jgi:hypothetical protein
MDVGYSLLIKYNGIFDPFRDEASTRLAISGRICGTNGHSGSNQGDENKSRFERLFDENGKVFVEEILV